ncbi:MAG: hypothetical protein HY721_19230 [Planctomycetes bacterium]|nr:hypothetical protein [Planctomycetota bacterium]
MERWSPGVGMVAGLAVLAFVPGCLLFGPPARSYRSNREVLAATAEACGFVVDPERYVLEGVDVREDSVTFQHRGAERAGDHAWVVRFSQKSTEQDPVALADVFSLLSVIAKGREGFAVRDERAVEVGAEGMRARYVRYHFDSPIHGEDGKPLPAHGILASARVDSPEGPIVYQLKLDNHGDREDVGWAELRPFVEAIARSRGAGE